MNVKNALVISSYVFLLLGTTLLWMGEWEQAYPYPLVVFLAAVAGYFLTDRWGVLQLPHLLSHSLGIVILVIIAREFWEHSGTNVVALAHFLVYLQVVKFFRVKLKYDFSMMYIMSLLQVAISCVINSSLYFGLLLIFYLFVAIGTLGLFQLCRDQDFQKPLAQAPDGLSNLSAPPLVGWMAWWERQPIRLRWRHAVLAVFVTLLCIPTGLLAFWILPRQNFASPLPSTPFLATKQMGMSTSVKLGEFGQLLENNQIVLQVWARDGKGMPAKLPEGVLWRGRVYSDYERSEWRGARRDASNRIFVFDNAERPELASGQLAIQIEQQVRTQNIAFCPRTTYWVSAQNTQGMINFSIQEHCITYRPHPSEPTEHLRPIEYLIHADLDAKVLRSPMEQPPAPSYLEQLTLLPKGLERLRTFTQQLLATLPQDADTRNKVARLQNYLTSSGQFRYSLDQEVLDPKIDPVEDFLFNRKQGHCEYFASAMALMLRAAGISTRLVHGFKGADYNQAGGFYQIRQLLAHAWVEAYIPEQGYWQTIDPTPGSAREEVLDQQRSPYQRLEEVAAASERFWLTYVYSYRGNTKEQSIWNYFSRTLQWWWQRLQNWGMDLAQAIQDPLRHWDTLLNTALLGMAPFLVWRLRQRFLNWRQSRTVAVDEPRLIIQREWFPLYLRWRAILQANSWHRPEAQTPLQFARQLQAQWQQAEHLQPFAQLPEQLVALTYQVHFGNQAVDAGTLAQLDQQLTLLEQQLQGNRDA